MTKGVDTIDHTLTGKTLAASDYAFVCRYYAGHTSSIGKEIIASEVVEKSAAGVRIVSNWETDGKPPNTVAAGEAHAHGFLKQHAEIGGPGWAPCYFSIDHAVAAGACDLYFEGVRNVLGVARVGCYGEGTLIRHLKAKGLISLGWLAMATAWPGGTDATGCDLHQTGRGTVAGHSVDFNTALTSYYGGWLLGEPQPNQEDDMDQATFNKLLKGALTDESTGILQAISIRVAHDVAHRGEYTPMPGNIAAASLATRVDGLATEVGSVSTAGVDSDVLATKVADLLAVRLKS